MHRPDDHGFVASAKRVDDVLKVTVTAGDNVNVSSIGMPGVGDDVLRHTHIGAVLTGEVEHRVNVRHHEAAGGFVCDFTPGGIDQRRQATTLPPRSISGKLNDLPVCLALPDEALDERIEVDDIALLVEADSDVFEVDVNGDVLCLLNTQQGFERLEDDLVGKFRAFQHVIRTPHTNAGIARRLNAPHQRNQIRVGGCQNQLIDRFRVEREVVGDQGIGEAFAQGNIEDFVASSFEHVLRINANTRLLLARLLPVCRSNRLQPVRTGQPRCQSSTATQTNREFL